jgi:CRP/FNR family transcriptional regulator, cyclic AMP receptor protein
MAVAEQLTPVLRADPALAVSLSGPAAEQAVGLALARSQWLSAGPWAPAVSVDEQPGHMGLLVLEGMLARHARLLDRVATELLGEGDLLRPWQPDDSAPFVAQASAWEVLIPTHVAVLDRTFTAIVGRWPEVVAALAGRAMRRSRNLALGMAISQIPNVHVRLLAVLWHIALRWGTVEAEGLAIPVRLTHELLGRLVSARRQTTTGALGVLVDHGLVSRSPEGCIVLHGEPPVELSELSDAVA